MVIELSGVQFGLKLYAWFQNWTSAQREFDLKSQVWFQTNEWKLHDPKFNYHALLASISRTDFRTRMKKIERNGGRISEWRKSDQFEMAHYLLSFVPWCLRTSLSSICCFLKHFNPLNQRMLISMQKSRLIEANFLNRHLKMICVTVIIFWLDFSCFFSCSTA